MIAAPCFRLLLGGTQSTLRALNECGISPVATRCSCISLCAKNCRQGLTSEQSVWRWSGDMSFSPTVIDLVDLYVGAAPAAILEVLDLIAVAEPLNWAISPPLSTCP